MAIKRAKRNELRQARSKEHREKLAAQRALRQEQQQKALCVPKPGWGPGDGDGEQSSTDAAGTSPEMTSLASKSQPAEQGSEGAEGDNAPAPALGDWLTGLRLHKYAEPLRTKLDVEVMEDLRYVHAEDLESIGMPKPSQRKLLAAAKRVF